MSKTVHLELSEQEYKEVMLCYFLGDLVKDSTEQKSHAEILSQLDLHQKLSKAGYEAKLSGASLEDGIYSYSEATEDEMFAIFEKFKEYIESGESAEEDEMIRQQIAEMNKQGKK